jgi:hypothetical protein
VAAIAAGPRSSSPRGSRAVSFWGVLGFSAIFGSQRLGGVGTSQGAMRQLVHQSDGASFRGDAKHRTRNLEIPGLVLRTIPE